MFKKSFMFLSLVLCLFSVSACSNSNNQKPAEQVNADSNEQTEEPAKEETKLEEPQTETAEEQEITLNLSFGERTGTYTGEMKDGLPNGTGKFITKNSEGITWYHEGEFKDGHFQGEAIHTWEDGQTQKGIFENDLWNPNSFQIYEWLESRNVISYVDNAKEFLENHTDLFPADNLDKISEFVDESIKFKMIQKEATAYGNKIIKLENVIVASISTTSIPDSSDKKYTYAICSLNNDNGTQNVYQIYFIGDMQDIFAEDTISTLYGIPLNTNSYQNVTGGYTNSIQLAVCYYEK